MKIELFVSHDEGVPYVYEKSWLTEQGIEGDKALEVFGDGRWHEIEVVSPFLGRHHQEVESKIYAWDEAAGTYKRDGTRNAGALVEVAVTRWTFKEEPTEAGFLSMENALKEQITPHIINACYPRLAGHKRFFDYLKTKRKSASEMATSSPESPSTKELPNIGGGESGTRSDMPA